MSKNLNETINTTAEARTMDVVLEEIKDNISKFNLSTDAAEKAKLELSLKTLENEWNELSLLSAWADFAKAENPMVAFAKAYTYKVIGHKDVDNRVVENGVKTIIRTRTVDYAKTPRLMEVAAFMEWIEVNCPDAVRNHNWADVVASAREAVIEQWRGFMNAKKDTHTVSVGKMKKALQSMVDALVFIEGSKGGNAVVVKGDVAKAVFALCNQRKDGLKGSIMNSSLWKKLQMDVLHACVSGKEFSIVYGDEEPAEEEQETEDKKSEASK